MGQIQFGTGGRLGLLKQDAFNTPQTNDTLFKYVAFTQCDFGPQQQQGALPPEAGNSKAFPRGVFKSGVHAEGGVSLIPRLEENFGYWLEAICGDVSESESPPQTIAQAIAASGTTAGVYSHLFGLVDGDDFSLPYMTAHRYLPNDTEADAVGEIIQDVRVAQWVLNAPASSLVTSRIEMLGRCNGATVWDINPGWSQPTLDDDDSFLVTACAGSVKMSVTGGTPAAVTSFDVLSARMTWTNVLLPPGQARVVGSPHPVDYPCLSRVIGFEVVVYVDDYDLYVQTFAGAADPVVDGTWLCSSLAGDIDLTFQSPALIGATAEYYQMRIRTTDGNINWLARPIVLAPNQPVLLAMTGSIVPATAGGRDIEVWLQNGLVAGY